MILRWSSKPANLLSGSSPHSYLGSAADEFGSKSPGNSLICAEQLADFCPYVPSHVQHAVPRVMASRRTPRPAAQQPGQMPRRRSQMAVFESVVVPPTKAGSAPCHAPPQRQAPIARVPVKTQSERQNRLSSRPDRCLTVTNGECLPSPRRSPQSRRAHRTASFQSPQVRYLRVPLKGSALWVIYTT